MCVGSRGRRRLLPPGEVSVGVVGWCHGAPGGPRKWEVVGLLGNRHLHVTPGHPALAPVATRQHGLPVTIGQLDVAGRELRAQHLDGPVKVGCNLGNIDIPEKTEKRSRVSNFHNVGNRRFLATRHFIRPSGLFLEHCGGPLRFHSIPFRLEWNGMESNRRGPPPGGKKLQDCSIKSAPGWQSRFSPKSTVWQEIFFFDF